MMKSRFLGLIFLIGLFGCDDTASLSGNDNLGISLPAMELTGRVVDEAELLDAESESQLIISLEKLEKEAGPQFVVATTNSLNGLDIAEYSVDLGRHWALGDSERDDGVILLVAPHERKVRIEVGYGLEGSLSDPFCAKIIREHILPAFGNGDIQKGILAGADQLILKMRSTPTIGINDNQPITSSKEKIAS